MNTHQQICKTLLLESGISLNSNIDFDVNGEIHTLSYEYIIDAFMQASEESQIIFVTAIQKAINTDENGVEKFFEKMGQLLLMTHMSKNITI